VSGILPGTLFLVLKGTFKKTYQFVSSKLSPFRRGGFKTFFEKVLNKSEVSYEKLFVAGDCENPRIGGRQPSPHTKPFYPEEE
jgi:hypothetical protein